MGGGFSKVQKDNYVLRVAPDGIVTEGSTKARPPLESQKSMRQRGDGPGSPLGKQKSSRIAVSHDDKAAAPSLSMTRGSSSRLSIKSLNNGQTSDVYPWLLKNTKLNNATLNHFEFGPVIGRGYSGTVRVMRFKNDKYCVFKAVRKDWILSNNEMRHVTNEKDVLSQLNCPFCVKMFATFQDKGCIYYALEYAPGGELFHRLDRKSCFAPDTAKFYISEVFVAIDHIQSQGFVYRDLKPENVMIDEEGHCKLVDFGFSRAANARGMMRTFCGTPAYLAPEILDGKFTNGYTKIVDWWSFAILVYELVTGKTPFCKNNKESHYCIFLRILQNRIWFPMGFDSASKDLIVKLTVPQLNKRLCEADEIRTHNYFTMDWNAVANRRLVPPFVPKLKTPGDTYYFNNNHNDYSPMSAGDGVMDNSVSYDFANF